ncbi:MAG: hypothetical protein WCP77_09445 [Roseococcus sp.]
MVWFALFLLIATFALAEFRDRINLEPEMATRAIAGGYAATALVFLIAALLEVSFLGFALCLAAGALAMAENRRLVAFGPEGSERAIPLIIGGACAVLLIAFVFTVDLAALSAAIGAGLAEMDRRQAGLNTVVLGAIGLSLFMFGSARGADRAATAGFQIVPSQLVGPAAMAALGLLMVVWSFIRS